MIELHGNILRAKCSREDVVIDQWAASDETPPRCPQCGAHLRPDVVWFGEALPLAALKAAGQAAAACDLFFSIGTSGLVEPAASLARTASERGAIVVEINPTATPLTAVATFVLTGLLGIQRGFLLERENDCLAGLLTAAVLIPLGNHLYFKFGRAASPDRRSTTAKSNAGPSR